MISSVFEHRFFGEPGTQPGSVVFPYDHPNHRNDKGKTGESR
jgi:hypothetical protein